MLILFAPLLLFGTALALTILHFIRPQFRFNWLASFVSASLACVTVLLWQLRLPTSTSLPGWEPAVPFAAEPTFAASTLSWSLAFTLTSLLVASLLVAPAWP